VLDAEASGMTRVLHHRGPTFELDSCARVLRAHGADAADLDLVVRNDRLITVDRLAQTRDDG